MKKLITIFLLVFAVVAVNGQKREKQAPPLTRVMSSIGWSNTNHPQSQAVQQFSGPVYAPAASVTVFSEGFESAAVGELPAGWVETSATGSGYWRNEEETWYGYPHTGNMCAFLEYLDEDNDAWMFSPAISLTEGTIYDISFWIEMEGYDGAYESFEVKIGTSQDAAGMTQVVFPNPNRDYASWTQVHVTFTAPSTGNYYLGFHDYTGFYDAGYVAIDDILVTSIEPDYDDDAGIVAITSPVSIGSSSAVVTATIKNFGSNPLTSVDVAYQINDETPVVETYTGNLAFNQTASFSFTTPVDLSQDESYILKVYTDLAGDEYRDNDTLTRTVVSSVLLYGYRLYEPQNANPYGFVSFESASPSTVTVQNTYNDGSDGSGIFAGEYVDDILYAYTVGYDYWYGTYPKNFVKLSDTWTQLSAVSTSSFSNIPSDMAYDHFTQTMYAIMTSSSITSLYTINLETGVATSVGSTGQNLVGLACNLAGQLYGVSTAGNFYSIDKATGTLTLIGATGFTSYAYIQSMSFDHNSGKLFWALSDYDDNGYLVEINPATGIGTLQGVIGNNAEIAMLYTPYFNGEVPEAPTAFTITPDPSGATSCTLNWTNPVLKRDGTALTELTSIVIKRDGVVVHTISPVTIGAPETWTDNTIIAPGNYVYTIYGTNTAGIGREATQSVLLLCSEAITTFPWTEGFEGGIMPECFLQQNIEGTIEWKVVTAATGTPGTTPDASSYKVRFYYEGFDSKVTKLITPRFDLTGLLDPVLKFWHAQPKWTSDQDTLRVYYKNSPAAEWVLLQEYTTDMPAWTEETILLPNASDAYYIAFEGKAQYAYGIHLDDLSIQGTVIDAAVLSIDQPNTGAELTGTETVQVTVKNLGTNEITSLPVTLEVNGTVIANETITEAIASDAEYIYTFTATADLSAIQEHTLKVYTTLTGDMNLLNDTVAKPVEHVPPVYDAAVLAITQPASGSHLTTTETVQAVVKNLSNVTLTSLPINLDVNGTVIATETITTLIAPNAEYIHTFTATADLSAFQTHIVKVYTTLTSDVNLLNDTITKPVVNTEIVYDASVLSITQPNSGNDLTGTETVQAVVKNLGDNAVTNLPINLEIDGTVIATETITASIAPNTEYTYTFTATADLSAVQNYTLKVYTTLENDANLSNDTITKQVEHYAVHDAGVIAIISPIIGGSATETVTATLKNFGNVAITSMEVAYTINNGTPVVETYTENLAVGATADYTFTATADLSADGNYLIKVYTILTNDADNTNDTSSVEISYTSGITTFSGANVEIYPNPATDKLTITHAAGVQAKIYDLTGKLLMDTQIQHDTEVINIEHLVSGIYFIELQDQQMKTTKKLIKQ